MSERLELRGERVLLRPMRADEVEILLANHGVGQSGMGSDPPDLRERLRKIVAASGTWDDGWLRLGIEHEGRLVGDIQARRPKRALPPGVCELGIGLFASADRGRGLGREAVSLLTDHLFDDPDTARVQGSTAVSNAAMRRVFEVLGFTFEGVMRGFMPTGDGGRDDYALYAVTREDRTRSS